MQRRLVRRSTAYRYSAIPHAYPFAEPVGEKNKPVKDILIESVTIHANPIAEDEAASD